MRIYLNKYICYINVLYLLKYSNLLSIASQDITLERLKYLRKKDLDELFKDKKVDLKIEFRNFLTKWQSENNSAPNSSVLQPLILIYCRTSLWLNHNVTSPSTSLDNKLILASICSQMQLEAVLLLANLVSFKILVFNV